MFSINLESLLPLPTLLRGVTPVPAPAGSRSALGGAMPSSSGAPLNLFAWLGVARPSSPPPPPSSLLADPPICPCAVVPAAAGAGAAALLPLFSPGSSGTATGALALPARATSLMLALLSSLRLVMLPVPSGCKRLSLCPPRNPPGALPPPASEDLPPPPALLPEMDFARGFCRRDLSQFLTRLVGDSFADSGEVFEDGDSGDGSPLALLADVDLVWILGVKGRMRCLCDVLSSVGCSAAPSGASLTCSPGAIATAAGFRFSLSSRAKRFSSALAAFSSSFLAFASCLSSPLLAFSSSVNWY